MYYATNGRTWSDGPGIFDRRRNGEQAEGYNGFAKKDFFLFEAIMEAPDYRVNLYSVFVSSESVAIGAYRKNY